MSNTWRDTLPEDLREAAILKDVPDINTLAKRFVDQSAFVGQSIRIPGPDAGDEDRQKFYDKLLKNAPNLMPKPDFDKPDQEQQFWRSIGRPDDAKGYTLPDGLTFDEATVESLRADAHALGLTKAQFNRYLEKYKAASEDISKSRADALKGLQTEWGQAYNERMARLEESMKQAKLPDEVVAAVKSGQLSPSIVNFLYSAVEAAGQAEGNLNDQSTVTGKLTPSQAKERVNEILNNPQHPYWNPEMAGHDDAIEKMYQYQLAANG